MNKDNEIKQQEKVAAVSEPLKQKNKNWIKLYYGLSFAIPFLFMFVILAINGVSPFGPNQVLVKDFWHQYYPFIVDFHDKLQTGDSLLWTWAGGGGSNFTAIFAYYLSSPLNFLSILIPVSILREFLYVLTCVKIGLAGLFFCIFLKKTFDRDSISLVAFSIMYALCAFIMGYYWNIIWLDTVALLPLVVTGTIELLRFGKFKLYITALSLAVLTNYYIGIFVCAFVFLICIGYELITFKKISKLFKDFLKVLGCTVIVILIVSILLIPSYMALKHTYAADTSFPEEFALNMGEEANFLGVMNGIGKTIANAAIGVIPTSKEGLPNVYSGAFILALSILFLFNSKIKIRERVYCLLLELFFIVSFVIRQLDYIWHGFHFPNMLPYRFSFLFTFVLIYMAYRVYMHIKETSLLSVILAFVGFMGVLVCIYLYGEKVSLISTAGVGYFILTMVVLCIYKKLSKKVLSWILFIVSVIEGGVSAGLGVYSVGVSGGSSYPLGTKNTYECVELIKDREKDTPELYRTDMAKYYTLNDTALWGLNGISMFNSMINCDATRYFEKFGICGWPASNRYTYQESSAFTNLMLNLKYIISPYEVYLDTQHNTLVHQSDKVILLENDYYIPMGFVVKEDILDYDIEQAKDNPMENQNEIFRMITGLDGDLYHYIDPEFYENTGDNMTISFRTFGSYSYKITDTSKKETIKFDIQVPYSGSAVLYFKGSYIENGTIYLNDEYKVKNYIKRPYIMNVGDVQAGDVISIKSDIKDYSYGTMRLYCAIFDDDLFKQGYDILKTSVMQTTKLTGDSMEGTIDVKESGVFYTSIPYVKGWTAYVDGEKVEITPIGNSMLAFKIDKGVHNIVLKYFPEGLALGITCFIIGIISFAILWIVYDLVQKKKKKNEIKDNNIDIQTDEVLVENE